MFCPSAEYVSVRCHIQTIVDGTVVSNSGVVQIPFLAGCLWTVCIEITSGQIVVWPPDTLAQLCLTPSLSTYGLLKDGVVLEELGPVVGAVPDFLHPRWRSEASNHIILEIDESGTIDKWDPSLVYACFGLENKENP